MALKVTQQDGSYFVTPEGDGAEPIEVDMSGYVASDELKSEYVPKQHFEREIKRRIGNATKGLVKRDEIINDESFLEDFVETHRDNLVERLGVKPTTEADLAKIREAIERKEVAPLKEQMESLQGTIAKLRENGFRADFGRAARSVGVDEEMEELVELWVRKKAQYHPESDAWVIFDGDEPALTTADMKGRDHPYMTIEDLLGEIESSGKHKSWFKARTRSGNDTRKGRDSGVVTLEAFDRMDSDERMELYRNNREVWQDLMQQTRKRGEAALFQ